MAEAASAQWTVVHIMRSTLSIKYLLTDAVLVNCQFVATARSVPGLAVYTVNLPRYSVWIWIEGL